MGLLWNLLQQSQISQQTSRTGTLEQRVVRLESELHRTRSMLHQLIKKLETKFNEDIDGDRRVG